jgi:hypothetical protein
MASLRTWWQSGNRKSLWLVAAASVAAATVLLGFFLQSVPVAHSAPVTFSGIATTPGYCSGTCAGSAVILGMEPLPVGPNVIVHWTDVTGGSAGFTVWSPSGPICRENGTSGVCSFVSMGGEYSFHADNVDNQSAQQVNYTGTYF